MATLERKLGLGDATLLVVGSVFGSGIFLTSGLVAEKAPSPALLLSIWLGGGILTIGGALAYAELSTMFPEAGGAYVYLREAYGRAGAFLYGWTFFWIIAGAGLAALAAGFAEYLAAVFPWIAGPRPLLAVDLGFGLHLSVSGTQIVAALAIVALSALNMAGTKAGARFQSALTLGRVAACLGLAGAGLIAGFRTSWAGLRPFAPSGAWPGWAGFGAAFVAVLWTYDGWYAPGATAEDIKRPGRTLPRALLLGTASLTALYLILNLVYALALPMSEMSGVVRIGEAAAVRLAGPGIAAGFTAFVALAIFGCLSANILFCSRVPFAMARDGYFLRRLADIHPRTGTPVLSFAALMAWSACLALTGTFRGLIEYVAFSLLLFFAATGFAVVVLRRSRRDHPRPYRVPGYPVVPLAYAAANLAILVSVAISSPVRAGAAAALISSGIPAYLLWEARRMRSARAGGAA